MAADAIVESSNAVEDQTKETPDNNKNNNHKEEETLDDNKERSKGWETFAVFLFIFTFVIAPFVLLAISIYCILNPKLWPIAIVYLLWYAYDFHAPSRGSRPSQAFRSYWLWNHLARYFPMKLVKTAELPPNRNYMIGVHPHGIIGFATYVTFCTEATSWSKTFPGLKRYPVTLPMQFWFPIRREVLIMTGTISSGKEAIEYILERPKKGYTVAIVPGGAQESLDSHPGEYTLTLSNRKGFVKLALKHGADLVPLYHFGENRVYSQLPNPEGSRLRRFQMAVKRWTGATTPFFYGRGIFANIYGLMPYRKPITTVVGAPIRVDPEGCDPTDEQVDELHAEYCRQLKKLFDDHKTKYGIPADAELVIQ